MKLPKLMEPIPYSRGSSQRWVIKIKVVTMPKMKSYTNKIEELLELGERKEKIFSELSSEAENTETLGWSLSHTPYPYLKSKYRIHSAFLAGLVILISVQFFIRLVKVRPNQLGLQLFGLFCFTFGFARLALNVVRFKPAAPFMVSFLGGALSVGLIFIALRTGHLSSGISLEIATTIAMLILGLWLSKRLAPRGVLLNIKAPRNKQGDIEFD
jgi:hypothetical protein